MTWPPTLGNDSAKKAEICGNIRQASELFTGGGWGGQFSYFQCCHISARVYLAPFSVHLLYQVSHSICVCSAWVGMILPECAMIGVWQGRLWRNTLLSSHTRRQLNRRLVQLAPCKFTHHMNPFFLSCQFPKLVRANVDERL